MVLSNESIFIFQKKPVQFSGCSPHIEQLLISPPHNTARESVSLNSFIKPFGAVGVFDVLLSTKLSGGEQVS